MTLRASVVRTIRPDTVFIPYHWPDLKSANQLTHRTLDPRSKIPEFKVSACRIRIADAAPLWATEKGTRDDGLVQIGWPPGIPSAEGAHN